jgi:allantoin racemase
MRVGVVHVTTEASSQAYTKMITETLDRARNAGTELVHRYVGHLRRATDTAIAYPTLLNKVDIVSEIVALERDGVDAVLVACSGDPGVAEARTLVSVPVVGPMEAAFGLVLGYGWRFGIVTVEDRTWSSNMDQLVNAAGLTGRYAGQRTLHTPTSVIFTKGFEEPAMVIDDLRARVREMVTDGADSVLVGSAGLSTFCSFFRFAGLSGADEPEVPVFDVITVGLKFAELRAELHQQVGVPPVSRAGWYARYPFSDHVRVNRQFGWVPEPVQP